MITSTNPQRAHKNGLVFILMKQCIYNYLIRVRIFNRLGLCITKSPTISCLKFSLGHYRYSTIVLRTVAPFCKNLYQTWCWKPHLDQLSCFLSQWYLNTCGRRYITISLIFIQRAYKHRQSKIQICHPDWWGVRKNRPKNYILMDCHDRSYSSKIHLIVVLQSYNQALVFLLGLTW